MSRGAEVVVAGAGVLGLSCALALADAGCRVTVCDPAREGSNASGVAAGMLAPVFETVLDAEGPRDFNLLMAARDLWPALTARAGIELHRTGAAAVGAPPWLARIRAGVSALGIKPIDLDRPRLEALAPGLASDLADGLLTTDDWRLDAGPGLAALRAAGEAAGVRYLREAVGASDRPDWLVIATGAGQDLAARAPELALLSPIKGQILRFPEHRGGGATLRGEGVYAAPGGHGLAVGATMEPGVSDSVVDPVKLEPLLQAGTRLLPGLSGAAFAAAAGVRAATPDGLPLAGLSAAPGILLAVGARRNGWLLAPLVARAVAACVTGQDAGSHAARLAPKRFASSG